MRAGIEETINPDVATCLSDAFAGIGTDVARRLLVAKFIK